MSRVDMKRAARIVVATTAIFLVVVGAIAWQVVRYPGRAPGGPARQARLVIEKGTTLAEVARRLQSAGIIERPRWFRFYASGPS
jgi:cell division protein YceG involved in septum cleavage